MQFYVPDEIFLAILRNLTSRELFFLKPVNRYFRKMINKIKEEQIAKYREDCLFIFHESCRIANYLVFSDCMEQAKEANSFEIKAACYSGDYNIPNYLIKIQKFDQIPIGYVKMACQSGNIKLAEKFIEMRNLKNESFWQQIFHHACIGGHTKMVKFVAEKGNVLSPVAWMYGFKAACKYGEIELAEFLVEKIGKQKVDWNRGLRAACYHKEIKMVKYLIANGASECLYCEKSIEEH